MPGRPRACRAAACYGETVAVDDFMTWSEWALARVGFRPSNCLPVVAVCRDELMADFGRAVTDVWGQPFEAGSLAGLVFLGRTGVQAALGHVPGEDGRHRFPCLCFPHSGSMRTARRARPATWDVPGVVRVRRAGIVPHSAGGR